MNTQRQALVLSSVLGIIVTLDSVTTWFAVRAGAREINPIINIFLNSAEMYVIFSLWKTILAVLLVYITYHRSRLWIIIYAIVTVLFVRASLINLTNWLLSS